MAKSAEPCRRKAYTPDIGWRVVWNRLGLNMTFSAIASRLQIATSTAYRIYKLFERTGDVTHQQSSSRLACRTLNEHDEMFIIALLMQNPSMYLSEMCTQVSSIVGVEVSGSTICRTIRRNGLTRKKIQTVAKQRSTLYRSYFLAQVLHFSTDSFVWIDETGCDARSHIRQFGYSIRGIPPVCHRKLVRGKRISALAAISADGLLALQLVHGTVNSNTFYDFIRGEIIPVMEPFDGSPKKSIVIMDNCSIHHVHFIKKLLEDAGILVHFLPPYSPDLNPIELAFSSIKYYLKDHDEILQSINDPLPIVKAAFYDSVTSEKCKAWISNCGY